MYIKCIIILYNSNDSKYTAKDKLLYLRNILLHFNLSLKTCNEIKSMHTTSQVSYMRVNKF